MPKVYSMISPKGNPVANQFYIADVPAGIYTKEGANIPSGEMFQSYESIIAFKDMTGQIWLDAKYWDYSRTTSKYRNQFLDGECKKVTQSKIDNGTYKLVHFND